MCLKVLCMIWTRARKAHIYMKNDHTNRSFKREVKLMSSLKFCVLVTIISDENEQKF